MNSTGFSASSRTAAPIAAISAASPKSLRHLPNIEPALSAGWPAFVSRALPDANMIFAGSAAAPAAEALASELLGLGEGEGASVCLCLRNASVMRLPFHLALAPALPAPDFLATFSCARAISASIHSSDQTPLATVNSAASCGRSLRHACGVVRAMRNSCSSSSGSGPLCQ